MEDHMISDIIEKKTDKQKQLMSFLCPCQILSQILPQTRARAVHLQADIILTYHSCISISMYVGMPKK